MNDIRIGKDFNVQWAIHKVVDGQRLPYDLAGKELQLSISYDNGRREVTGWKVKGNVIEWTFFGKDQKRLGAYQLILVENAGKEGMVTVDTCKAFNLVAHSCEEDVEGGNGIVIETITLESEVALAPVVKEIGGGASEEDIQEIKNDIADLQQKDVQTDNKLTELSEEVGGDLIVEQVSSSGALNYNINLEPPYSLKEGDTIVMEITDIVASDVFAAYLRNGATNIARVTSVLSSKTLRLEHTATSDVEINSILLYKNDPITLSCTIQIYSELGLKGELSGLQTKVDAVEIGLEESQNEITEIKGMLEENKSIDLIADALISDDWKQVIDYEVIDGKYVNFAGNYGQIASMDVWLIPARKGDKFRIVWKSATGGARMYGVYSTDASADINSSTLIELGPQPAEASEAIVEITDENAKSLAVTWYSIYETKVFKSESVLKYDFDAVQATFKNLHHYSYDGEKLSVAFLNNGRETTYLFAKCMANELFTFSKVGTRDTSRQTASSEGIANGVGITYFNETYSDNIGPLSMRNGGWTGGNHLKGSQKTAKTESVTIYADNKVLESGDVGFANLIKVEVVNTIYDPSQEITGDILTQKLATEKVTYIVHDNTIEVGVSLSFVETTNKLATYYGMQSMFVNEDSLLVPNGSCKEWTAVDNSTTLSDKKSDFPEVNRFIEKSSTNNTYQSTYLIGVGLGKHIYLNENDTIFSRSYSKDYHSCVKSDTDISGKTLRWNGCYTFFVEPLMSNEQIFAYYGYINGRKALFIYAFGAFKGFIELKGVAAMENTKIVENTGFVDNDGTTDFIIGGGGLFLQSEKEASLILLVA